MDGYNFYLVPPKCLDSDCFDYFFEAGNIIFKIGKVFGSRVFSAFSNQILIRIPFFFVSIKEVFVYSLSLEISIRIRILLCTS